MLEALSPHTTQASTGTDVLGLAERRMQWLQTRESVLAGNVANADTPGYVAKDIAPFQGVLQSQMTMMLAQTEAGHLPGRSGSAEARKVGGTSSPDGNEVTLETELEKVADTNDQQRFATSAYSTYMSMYTIALGASGS
ncbi:flagellar basal body protein [Acetobacter sp. TBRC 12305]|uniref:Flagellar biosynthesis protein FlgB n=1 Tax=Acetobacter garciniae TaxID=2817435 RepID=A0A939KQ22_9PROT|nr:flagellar basal body protein [Acetobacter garciniae]MBO1324759.1 flagellar biosynthesis protein FlgB [Acetobacter garciniae]MBX0344450.1 flagellar basal body protein [Acetobacter garciniae]